jgi:hypothetical protein
MGIVQIDPRQCVRVEERDESPDVHLQWGMRGDGAAVLFAVDMQLEHAV